MWTWFHRWASPPSFYGFADRLAPWLAIGAVLLLGYGLGAGLWVAPKDYQQGDAFRIIYVHVPAAAASLSLYVLMAMAGVVALIWRIKLAECVIVATAPVGASFTALALLTGMFWGKPMWGTYWVWDARLTSVLVLLLIYLGIIALWRALDEPSRAGRAVAILTLVGFVNVPVIKFSVDWWNTLHQPASVLRMGGPTIHPSMLWPLLILAVGFTCLALALHLGAMRAEIMRRRVRTLTILEAERLDRLAGQGMPA